MKETKELLKRLLDYLEGKNEGYCLCDVLDRMYVAGLISFTEMKLLHHYIMLKLDTEVIDLSINISNPKIFINYLRVHIQALQGSILL